MRCTIGNLDAASVRWINPTPDFQSLSLQELLASVWLLSWAWFPAGVGQTTAEQGTGLKCEPIRESDSKFRSTVVGSVSLSRRSRSYRRSFIYLKNFCRHGLILPKHSHSMLSIVSCGYHAIRHIWAQSLELSFALNTGEWEKNERKGPEVSGVNPCF